MIQKTLSIFIDESDDFGTYDHHAPFYLITMILHNQNMDISKGIRVLEDHLQNLGFEPHTIHTGPLIRRESIYIYEQMENRKKLFHALDLVCTMNLLFLKAESKAFTRSELEFFCSLRDFKKNYWKALVKKQL